MYLQLPSHFNVKIQYRELNNRGLGNSDQSLLKATKKSGQNIKNICLKAQRS